MEYNVVNKSYENREAIEKLISKLLSEYSKHLFGFTKNEFDSIAEYDVLNIMSFYYSKMNMEEKSIICDAIYKTMHLADIEEKLENLAMFTEDEMYIPLSCKLIDRLGDSRITMIIYESIFSMCSKMTVELWDESDSYSNYLSLLNAGYFGALAYKLHVSESYKACLNKYYGKDNYDDLIDYLYEKNIDDLGWDEDVELDVMEELLDEAKQNASFSQTNMEELSDAASCMEDIRYGLYQEYIYEEEKEGFEYIIQKTGIKEHNRVMISGFECHFCQGKSRDTEYIIIYQKEKRICEIVDKEEEWAKFQHDIYYADIREDNSTGMVYIIYILDKESSNIPIQLIESNKTYGRKYVFTEKETVTFINGIVKTTNEEIKASSPVQEWDKILREEHLTGCMTESYASKKVESYLQGERFDADYVQDDDYGMLTHSIIPQIKWVKSLDTSGFRSFCFDDRNMEFAQINLFHGANGSGKTSVLEAIEYALTSEVRRVKDFKVKMPSDDYPQLHVYDRQAGVHRFYPALAKQNNKEIERVWYGVPIGRTKSNLNENFNRFNAFDSEAAYKFIHESDNSEGNYASMFGNLMFGETVVGHEKYWQRYKKAFDKRYSELRSELNEARSMVSFYEEILANKKDEPKADEIEKGLLELKYLEKLKLSREASVRYAKVMDDLKLIRKYVDVLATQAGEQTFDEISDVIVNIKKQNSLWNKVKRDKNEEISNLTEKNGDYKQKIFEEQEKRDDIQEKINRINVDIKNWSIVQNVLGSKDTLKLVDDLLEELAQVDQELYYISKIGQRTAVINFLKLDDYTMLSKQEVLDKKYELEDLRDKKNQLENHYEQQKKAYGEKEQLSIELREIGKTLLTDSKCPLCGHEYESRKQLVDIIDNSVVIDDKMDGILSEMQQLSKKIVLLENMLEREKLIEKAKAELKELSISIPAVSKYGSDYKTLYSYYLKEKEFEKRKSEIIEQQTELDRQGFSLKNIKACREYQTSDPSYVQFKNEGIGTFDSFLSKRMEQAQRELSLIEIHITDYEKKINQNKQREELLKNDIRGIDIKLSGLDIELNRSIEQSIETIKNKFEIPGTKSIRLWTNKYFTLFDQCELEIERLESQDSIAFEKKTLAEYKATVRRLEPQVSRCAKAVRTFEKMPSLNTLVDQQLGSKITTISNLFTRMHHSHEFEELGIDEEGLYAIRMYNSEKIRIYQMSTGQRATIAMAVMFTLHMSAKDAPRFLLLDEPLATMDDIQVRDVLIILEELAKEGTQIFFTSANGIMINLFKEHFKNTEYDYKEYQFIKRVNCPSEIKETSVNDAKTIEELSLDDLVLDFNQFAQIRSILAKNQEKLVTKDELETENIESSQTVVSATKAELQDNFFNNLTQTEAELLQMLISDENMNNANKLISALKGYSAYRIMFEKINEKAMDFFGETIVVNDAALPWIDEDYIDEIKEQYQKYAQ